MAAHLVHHHHHTPRRARLVQGRNALVQVLQHDFVKTLTVSTQAWHLQRARQRLSDTGTQALAARLIVQPQHFQP